MHPGTLCPLRLTPESKGDIFLCREYSDLIIVKLKAIFTKIVLGAAVVISKVRNLHSKTCRTGKS